MIGIGEVYLYDSAGYQKGYPCCTFLYAPCSSTQKGHTQMEYPFVFGKCIYTTVQDIKKGIPVVHSCTPHVPVHKRGIHKWNTRLTCTARSRGHTGMGQVLTFVHVGYWNTVQAGMLNRIVFR